jgi:hypothetical protein
MPARGARRGLSGEVLLQRYRRPTLSVRASGDGTLYRCFLRIAP